MSQNLFVEIDLPFYALVVADSRETAIQSYIAEMESEAELDLEIIQETAQCITKQDAVKKFTGNEPINVDVQKVFNNLENGEILIYDEELIEKWSKTI